MTGAEHEAGRESSAASGLSELPAGPEQPTQAEIAVQRARAQRARAQAKEKGPRSWKRTLVEVIAIVAAAFALAMLVQAFIVKPFTIHQFSMEPTLEDGDRILINRLSYHFHEPEVGDVVVFRSPVDKGEDLVKRIVAVAGDTVAVRDGDLYVNGKPIVEPYLLEQDFGGEYPETTILDGQVFVLGDNRNNSGDSRLFGPIDIGLLIGKAFAVYWPIKHWGGI